MFKKAWFLIALIGFIIYSNSLGNEFCNDDYKFIVENPSIKYWNDWGFLARTFNTRFLLGLSFAANYAVGQLNVFGYHLVNIFIHILNAILVKALVSLLFQTSLLTQHPLRSKSNTVGLLTALLFLTHPIQTEAVTFVTQRAVSLASFFYLLCLVCYLKNRIARDDRFYLAAFGALFLGMLTKEMLITAPLALVALEAFFFCPRARDLVAPCRKLLPFLVMLAFIPILMSQATFNSILNLKFQVAKEFSWDYFFTVINVVRSYLGLLIFPLNQQLHYLYPIAKGFSEPKTWFSLLLILSIGVYAFRKFRQDRLVSFSILWFFGTMVLELGHVCWVKAGVMYDHWLYLPMVGFALLLVLFAVNAEILGNIWITRSLLVIVALWSVLTYQRNFDWKDEITLWSDGIAKSLQNSTAYYGLASAYSRRGDYPRAMALLEKAIEYNPKYLKAIVGLGSQYERQGDFVAARAQYRRALDIDPNFFTAYLYTGQSFLAQGDPATAVTFYQKALACEPNYFYSHLLLASAYSAMGRVKEAEDALKKAYKINPDLSKYLPG